MKPKWKDMNTWISGKVTASYFGRGVLWCVLRLLCLKMVWESTTTYMYVCTRLRHSAPSKQNRRESIRLSERAAIRTAMADCKIISSGFRSHNNVSASFTFLLSIIFLRKLGIQIRNMKMVFNFYCTWCWVTFEKLMMKIYKKN